MKTIYTTAACCLALAMQAGISQAAPNSRRARAASVSKPKQKKRARAAQVDGGAAAASPRERKKPRDSEDGDAASDTAGGASRMDELFLDISSKIEALGVALKAANAQETGKLDNLAKAADDNKEAVSAIKAAMDKTEAALAEMRHDAQAAAPAQPAACPAQEPLQKDCPEAPACPPPEKVIFSMSKPTAPLTDGDTSLIANFASMKVSEKRSALVDQVGALPVAWKKGTAQVKDIGGAYDCPLVDIADTQKIHADIWASAGNTVKFTPNTQIPLNTVISKTALAKYNKAIGDLYPFIFAGDGHDGIYNGAVAIFDKNTMGQWGGAALPGLGTAEVYGVNSENLDRFVIRIGNIRQIMNSNWTAGMKLGFIGGSRGQCAVFGNLVLPLRPKDSGASYDDAYRFFSTVDFMNAVTNAASNANKGWN